MGKEESGLRKILIVEDDKVLNKTLAYNLTADGYEVTSAYSFLDAVARLKESEFDIALLDDAGRRSGPMDTNFSGCFL